MIFHSGGTTIAGTRAGLFAKNNESVLVGGKFDAVEFDAVEFDAVESMAMLFS